MLHLQNEDIYYKKQVYTLGLNEHGQIVFANENGEYFDSLDGIPASIAFYGITKLEMHVRKRIGHDGYACSFFGSQNAIGKGNTAMEAIKDAVSFLNKRVSLLSEAIAKIDTTSE